MHDRHIRQRRARDGRGDARNHRGGRAGGRAGVPLFAAGRSEGTALEPYTVLPADARSRSLWLICSCKVDAPLGILVTPVLAACKAVGHAIAHDHVGFLDRLQPGDGQQSRISWTAADQDRCSNSCWLISWSRSATPVAGTTRAASRNHQAQQAADT